MKDEAKWMERVASGERAAFERLLSAFGPRVHRLARRYAATECDAEDLTQEIFVALFRSSGSFRGESQLSTWVYRVALNHCLRHRERASRAPSTSTTSGSPDFAAASEEVESADRGGDPARALSRSELGEQVRGALGELSPGHRDVIVLHEMHGLTYSQCAHILDVPIGTVKSRLFNALRHLKRHLEPYVLGSESASFSSAQPTSPSAAPSTSASNPAAARGDAP